MTFVSSTFKSCPAGCVDHGSVYALSGFGPVKLASPQIWVVVGAQQPCLMMMMVKLPA